MKFVIKLLAALAAIAGAAFVAFKCINNLKNKENEADKTPESNGQYAPLSNEKPEPAEAVDDSKSASMDKIGVRHQTAAVEMKESLDNILETSVPEDEKNETRLGQIFEDLEEI